MAEQCWLVTKADFVGCTKDRVSLIASSELRLSALRCHQPCSDHALVLLLPLGDLIVCNKNCCNSASHGCQISSLVATDLWFLSELMECGVLTKAKACFAVYSFLVTFIYNNIVISWRLYQHMRTHSTLNISAVTSKLHTVAMCVRLFVNLRKTIDRLCTYGEAVPVQPWRRVRGAEL